MKRFMTSMYTARSGFDEGILLADLPPSMAEELRYHLYKSFVVKVPIFSNIAETAVNKFVPFSASLRACGSEPKECRHVHHPVPLIFLGVLYHPPRDFSKPHRFG